MLSMQLLEKISVCVQLSEPVLLVGETGTGKTTVVQYLADLLGQKLVVMVTKEIFSCIENFYRICRNKVRVLI